MSATPVSLVGKLFPTWRGKVPQLALCNRTFRDLCEQYRLAVEALDALEIRNRPQDVEKMWEYRALIRDLEADLRQELTAAYPINGSKP